MNAAEQVISSRKTGCRTNSMKALLAMVKNCRISTADSAQQVTNPGPDCKWLLPSRDGHRNRLRRDITQRLCQLKTVRLRAHLRGRGLDDANQSQRRASFADTLAARADVATRQGTGFTG
jgi:hypothetical protein